MIFKKKAANLALCLLLVVSILGSLRSVAASPDANMVSNSSLEMMSSTDSSSPEGWQKYTAVANTVTHEVVSGGHTGKQSLRVAMANYIDGDAYWIHLLQPAQGNKTYEFSNYYKSDVDTYVYAHVVLQDGSEQWLTVGTAWHSADWNKFDQQFNTPAGTVSIQVYHSLSAQGFLITDDYQLVEYNPIGYNRPLLSITFDDGHLSTYENGLPILQQCGLPSTHFIVPDWIGTDSYMTRRDFDTLAASPLVEIGSHSMDHSHLPLLNTQQLRTQAGDSKSTLLNWLGIRSTTSLNMASPFGEYNAETLAAIRSYYRSHRSVDVGFNSKDNFDIHNIKVQNVIDTTTLEQIAAWVDQAQRENTWLVLVYHAVNPDITNEGTWNTTPEQFAQQMEYIKNSGITVKTLDNALDEITFKSSDIHEDKSVGALDLSMLLANRPNPQVARIQNNTHTFISATVMIAAVALVAGLYFRDALPGTTKKTIH